MISREAIEQILAQYAKHGWILRRVLLSGSFRESLPEIAKVFNGAEISESPLDGLWFSRSSRPGVTAWELRHLSQTPYALVENILDGTATAEAGEILKRVETKMIESVANRPPGH